MDVESEEKLSKQKIITVTLNPSLDRTVPVQYLAQGYHNRTKGTTRLDPAGAGVNISRAALNLEQPTHAIVVLDDQTTGYAYRTLLDEVPGLAATAVTATGTMRSNTILVDSGNNEETQLIEEGTPLTTAVAQKINQTLQQLIQPHDWVVIAGDAPPQTPLEIYQQLLQTAQQAGAKTAVAVSAEVLAGLLDLKPDLVALTRLQTECFFNLPVRVVEDMVTFAEQLQQRGARTVLIEQESAAAYLLSAAGAWLITLPEVAVGSSNGIWDALLAGFLAERIQKRPFADALKMGAAAAAFTAGQMGNEFGTSADITLLPDAVISQPTV